MEAVMETDPLLWMPGSFYRRPEWRWLRAAYRLAVGHKRDSRFDDCWVDEARLALRGSSKIGSSAAAVQAAHKLWTGDPAVRYELEAFLLTDEPFEKIAQRCKATLSTVEAYEAVFFAVRSMREANIWLFARVIKYTPWSGFTGPMPSSVWKLAALSGGPQALELVIAVTTEQPLPTNFFNQAAHRGAAYEKYTRQFALNCVELMTAVTDEEVAVVIRSQHGLRDQFPQFVDLGEPLREKVAEKEDFLVNLPARKRGSNRTTTRTRRADGSAHPVPKAAGQVKGEKQKRG